MISEHDLIIDYLQMHKGLDFSGCYHTLTNRQLKQRLNETGIKTLQEYYEYLQSNPHEPDHLINALTINMTSFFRDPLAFDFLGCKILPKLISEKIKTSNSLLRIWSAGCATGEEPYSIAIEIKELLKNKQCDLAPDIFATDIDINALNKARAAVYQQNSLDNIKYKFLKYFIKQGTQFCLKPELQQLVNFSQYDLLDGKSFAPPESIYGSFDIVLCRNVLIYYNEQYQNKIFNKLYRSIKENGYLVLGETEIISTKYHSYFRKMNDCCQIYQKNS